MAIPEEQRDNFETLRRACKDDDLALMECTDAKTGEPVFVICASNMSLDENGECVYDFVPIARMFDGNPYEEVNPPEVDMETSDGDLYVCGKDEEEEEEGEAQADAGAEQVREGGSGEVDREGPVQEKPSD